MKFSNPNIFILFTLLSLPQIGFSQTCKVTDYLYLNDPQDYTTNGFVHKMKINPDGSMTEVGDKNGNFPWFPQGGGLSSPHGLGQDLNGNLYIGVNEVNGPIAKLKCDGTLEKLDFIQDAGFNIVSKDGYLFVNSSNSNRITRYSLCDGSIQGYVTLEGLSPSGYTEGDGSVVDWGLEIAADGTIYASAGWNAGNNSGSSRYIYRFKPTDADFNAHTNYTAIVTSSGSSLFPGAGTAGISDNNQVWGITHDNSGNMYVVVHDDENDWFDETWILKYNSSGTLVASTMELKSSPTGGFEGARGILYYEPLDILYTAAGPDGDCIAKLSPYDLSYLGAAAPNTPGQNPKTIRIASEACPVEASTKIKKTLCNVNLGDKVFLQTIVGSCSAPICGGSWAADGGNIGITFNQCDLSFTITGLNGCGKFTLTNVGGTCGDFTVEVDVDFANVIAPVIAGNQTVCSGTEDPAAFTAPTPATGSGTIKYQWQKSTTSCTDGFTDIDGATSATYDPSFVSQTTYYRVIASVSGGCTTPNGSCSATSNCVTLTTKTCIPTCNAPTPTGTPTQRCGEGTVSLTASGCTTGYTAKWYSESALTTEVGSGDSFTTPSISATTSYWVACVEDATPTCKSAGVEVIATIKPTPTISAGVPVCNTAGTEFEVSYTATAGAAVTADKGTVDATNNKITGVPSGQTVTITVNLNGCTANTTATQNCLIPCPSPNCGSVTVIKN